MKYEVIPQSFEVITPKEVYKNFDLFLEKIARVCYKSEDKITKGSATELLRKIMNNGHGSVLEHANLTIKLITDRAVTHRIVRHRHCAFMQESTHYIDYNKKGMIQVIEQANLETYGDALNWDFYMATMAELYDTFDGGYELASSIFPQSLKTELIITTSILEWRHILKVRTQPKCHPQTRACFIPILRWFKENLPLFVEDIDEQL